MRPARGRRLHHTFAYGEMKRRNGGKQMRDYWGLTDDGEGIGWEFSAPGPRERLHGRHPTQKPLALLERIITASSKADDVVLDPFNGSGTTGVAAVGRRRRYVGIDLSRPYLDLTERRIAAVVATESAA